MRLDCGKQVRRDKEVVYWTEEQEERRKKLHEEMKSEVDKQIDDELREWKETEHSKKLMRSRTRGRRNLKRT